MNLYVIRHGETEWNKKGMLQGWKNSNLTNDGIKAAENLRDSFKEKGLIFDAVYTSTQQRAIDTAKIILEGQDIEIIKMDDLKELGFGKWDGMLLSDVHKEHEEAYNNYMYKPELYEPTSGGESFEVFFKRVSRSLNDIIDRDEENVLIVTHGVTIKSIIAIAEKIDIENFNEIPIYEGTALNMFEIKDGNIRYVLKGDTSHLGR